MFRVAKALLWATLLYNVVEGALALWSAAMARSVALAGFGLDSYLEVGAAGLVLWRLSVTDEERGERIEGLVVRFIGWTFLVLSLGIVVQSAYTLSQRAGADESLLGIILAALSVAIMPGLALWKLRVAAEGGLHSIAIEAKETLACSYLSLTLLVGLLANAWLGWWWLDAATALMLVPWLVREGLEGIRGEEHEESGPLCWGRECLFGLRKCVAECCVPDEPASLSGQA